MYHNLICKENKNDELNYFDKLAILNLLRRNLLHNIFYLYN